jgi:hypothetical protein
MENTPVYSIFSGIPPFSVSPKAMWKFNKPLSQLRFFRDSLLRDDQHTYAARLGEIVESLEEWYEGALDSNEEVEGFEELSKVYREANSIYESKLSDEAKYDLIFSKKISQKVPFSWYDPDTSYEEDVRYFMNAFREYMGGAPR